MKSRWSSYLQLFGLLNKRMVNPEMSTLQMVGLYLRRQKTRTLSIYQPNDTRTPESKS